MQIMFPVNNYKYYDTHYRYVLNLLKYDPNNTITYYDCDSFIVVIDGEKVLFDIADDTTAFHYNPDAFKVVFKFHYSFGTRSKRIKPFPPISFYDWNSYYHMDWRFKYKPENSIVISNRQVPYGNATERRRLVANTLDKCFGTLAVHRTLEQNLFFADIEAIRLSVCVPGFCNNMVDRGQLQYMGLGVATISPFLPEVFPFWETMLTSKEYIMCGNDYNDLIVLITQTPDSILKSIGDRAKEFFQKHCSPSAVNTWIKGCLDGTY